jgi:phage tail P2-like protein
MNLLPSNSTPTERAIAESIARISAVPVPIRDIWNPDECPSHLLPWLAWTLSVEAWDASWEDFRKRAVIKSAVETARVKGTRMAVSEALAALGASVVITEWFEMEPPGDPHTFAIEIVGNTTSIEMQNLMAAEVERTKPLRSHVEINWGVEFEGAVNVVGILRAGFLDRITGEASVSIFTETYTDPTGALYTDPTGETYSIYV